MRAFRFTSLGGFSFFINYFCVRDAGVDRLLARLRGGVGVSAQRRRPLPERSVEAAGLLQQPEHLPQTTANAGLPSQIPPLSSVFFTLARV